MGLKQKEKLFPSLENREEKEKLFLRFLKVERRTRHENQLLRATEKNLNHFSSRISRDRDSCQCLKQICCCCIHCYTAGNANSNPVGGKFIRMQLHQMFMKPLFFAILAPFFASLVDSPEKLRSRHITSMLFAKWVCFGGNSST